MNNKDKAGLFLHYWQFLADDDMPEPVAEYNFDKIIGRKHRFDWAFVDQRIAVEIDGGQFAPHGGNHATDSDREKLNLAASLRWLVFRFSPKQLEANPIICIELVEKAIKDSL